MEKNLVLKIDLQKGKSKKIEIEKKYSKKFDPKYSIVEDYLNSQKCSCSCFCGSCKC